MQQKGSKPKHVLTDPKYNHNAGGPSAEDRRQAERLQEILRELDAMRQALPNDAAHNAAFRALAEAAAAILRAQEALLSHD